MGETLYDILKIREDAPPEIIRAAYKTLSSMYHPDKNPDDLTASEAMKRINSAYRILRDPESRARYDKALQKMRAESMPRDEKQAEEPMPAKRPTTDKVTQPHFYGYGHALARIWNGQEGLCSTYWGYGVIGSAVLAVLLVFLLNLTTPGGALGGILALLFLVYCFVVHVGIWRAAGKYEGPAVWAALAKCAVVIPVMGIAAAIALPAYLDYKVRSSRQNAQAEAPKAKSQIDAFLEGAPSAPHAPTMESAAAWTQFETFSSQKESWMAQQPTGTRFCRLADGGIVVLYPPGAMPASPKANPFCFTTSAASLNQLD